MRKAKEGQTVFFPLLALGSGHVAQAWPVDALALVFESLEKLKMFKGADGETQVPRNSLLSVE